jgi:hypothetical protein
MKRTRLGAIARTESVEWQVDVVDDLGADSGLINETVDGIALNLLSEGHFHVRWEHWYR